MKSRVMQEVEGEVWWSCDAGRGGTGRVAACDEGESQGQGGGRGKGGRQVKRTAESWVVMEALACQAETSPHAIT